MKPNITPTLGKERIQSLDIIRGFAILGILIMNIQSFSMPGSAYSNPTAFGDLLGINKYIWIFSHLLADQKFMNIFAILYGAGIVLVTSKSEFKTGKSAGIHYKRTFWLLLIGFLHAHFIWYGDILVAYSLCALILYPLRKLKPSLQLVLGFLLFSIHSIIYLFFGYTIDFWPSESVSEVASTWAPSVEYINYDIGMFTGTIFQQIQHNSLMATYLQTNYFLLVYFWRVSGLMLIGMAFYKLGFLSAKKSNRYYLSKALTMLPIGFLLIIIGLNNNFNAGWDWKYSMFIGSQFNYWGSLFLSIGYICLITLFIKSPIFFSFKNKIAAVGQMALTNYISQSIICVIIFFGIGFGFFGQLERWEQILIVISVWALQFFWSKPWLDHFQFGPLEWFWRSITYWKKQTFKKNV